MDEHKSKYHKVHKIALLWLHVHVYICVCMLVQYVYMHYMYPGADPEIFERGGPEAIIHKILERGGPNSLKMAFECSFQLFSYKSFANIPPKGGAQAPWAPPLNLPLVPVCSVNTLHVCTISFKCFVQ